MLRGEIRGAVVIATWEVRRLFSTMSRDVAPVSIGLIILLLLVTGVSTQSGFHLSDGMYQIGVDDEVYSRLMAGDDRFVITFADRAFLEQNRNQFDLIITQGFVSRPVNERGRSAIKALQRDYERYVSFIYNQQTDLFAAYPLWIDTQYVKSELDFLATQSGERIFNPGQQSMEPPFPDLPFETIEIPSGNMGVSTDQLRSELVKSSAIDPRLSRYSEMISGQKTLGTYKTPAMLSPPLPFDSIILVFIFIFPLYFTSQFFMMSIMNERIGRSGEPLLSVPLSGWALLIGKAIPYFLGMVGISVGLTLFLRAPPSIIFPLIPVIFFFLASALLIGMVSRSFKELSFISIFFSTVATCYLFFPTIFANVHVISKISPLTLIVLAMQGTGYTISDYFFATTLFFLTAGVLFYAAVRSFNEEQLFSEKPLLAKIRSLVGGILVEKHPYSSLFVFSILLIPLVFMVQMMYLVLFFNLPMPYSIIALLVLAAFTEELAKSVGLVALFERFPHLFTWKNVFIAAFAVAAGFLLGEKLLLFVTLSQITESVFGSVLFLSTGTLFLPLLLHFGCTAIVGIGMKLRPGSGYYAGLALATAVHCLYNVVIIGGLVS
jgi:ABC-type Na+ efflux pump permease subunit